MRTDASHPSGRSKVGGVAVRCAPFALVACTHMLGIDGNYVPEEQTIRLSSGGSGAFGPDAWNFATTSGTGGTSVAASGGASTAGFISGNGGIPIGVITGGASGDAAPLPESGGTCPSCPPSAVAPSTTALCPFGTYAGSASGQHSASILAGFRLPVTGTVTFSVAPDPASSNAIVNGKIEGSATIGPNSFADFSATLTGSFDCADGSMKGTIDGTYAVATGAPPVPFAGTHEGTFANDLFDGSWTEHEIVNATMNQYFGTGKWSAVLAGP